MPKKVKQKKEKKRSTFFTVYLILGLIGIFSSLTNYISNYQELSQFFGVGIELLWINGIILLIYMLFMIGIFNWKRWGVYGYFITAFFSFIFSGITFGWGLGFIFLIINSGIMFLFIRKIWEAFD